MKRIGRIPIQCYLQVTTVRLMRVVPQTAYVTLASAEYWPGMMSLTTGLAHALVCLRIVLGCHTRV